MISDRFGDVPKMSIELHPRTGGLSCRESSSSNCKVYLSRATWGSESRGDRFMFSKAFQELQSVEAGGGEHLFGKAVVLVLKSP